MEVKKHFEDELEILRAYVEEEGKGKEKNDLVIEDFIPDIYSIIEKFSKQRHSGFSASAYANILSDTLKKILLFQPISPITGNDSEWMDVAEEDGKDLFQNKRCSALFKVGKDGKPYYLDAIVFKGEMEYDTFTSNDMGGISSRQYIRLPFTPKTFYIDVITKKINDEEMEYILKDKNQLIEVAQYYDMEKVDG